MGKVILFGDLNEVRDESERIGSSFSSGDAAIFNSFIQDVSLIDLPMEGRRFTWMNKASTKLSKIDRFLISEGVLDTHLDFQDVEDMVREAWESLSSREEGSTMSLHEKLKDTGCANDEDRLLYVNKLQEQDGLKKLESINLVQKAWVKWEVEGVENSKFFHCVINSRRKSQMIQGIMHESVWITDTNVIKTIFLNFYKDKFNCHDNPVNFPPMSAVKSLSDLAQDYLDSGVSLEEIQVAV
ncbi:RNA-directed DNA polymerase, eukaryota, reverse transcriptase zinc-binding domain protein [Tanacetum coccineum]